MRILPVAALSLAALVVAACTSGGSASVAPTASVEPSAPPVVGGPATAEELDARTFIVTGAVGYTVVEGSEIALTFEDGRLGISAGCNQMGGGYELADGVLTVGPMMQTEMACEDPLMAQDAFMAAFVNGATATLDGDVLTLAKDDITLTATDKTVARPDLPVEGTIWAIDGLISAQAVSSMPEGVTASLVFENGQVNVSTGCNTGSGSAEIGDTSIAFGPIATTKMACEDAAMGIEAHVLQVLQGDVAFEIDSDSLTLTGAGGGVTAKGS